MFKVLQLKV